MSLVSKDTTSVGSLCERANSDGTRDFAGDTDLQAPFRNVVPMTQPQADRNVFSFDYVINEMVNVAAVQPWSYGCTSEVC